MVWLQVELGFLFIATACMGCKVDSFLVKYFGLPLSNKRILMVVWHLVIDSVQKGLSLWKGPLLSVAGRLTLMKSTLASIPFLLYVFILYAIVGAKFFEKSYEAFSLEWEGVRKLYG